MVFFIKTFGIYKKFIIFVMLLRRNKMKKIELTMNEIWQATRPIIQKSKKTYTRKTKHKNKENN